MRHLCLRAGTLPLRDRASPRANGCWGLLDLLYRVSISYHLGPGRAPATCADGHDYVTSVFAVTQEDAACGLPQRADNGVGPHHRLRLLIRLPQVGLGWPQSPLVAPSDRRGNGVKTAALMARWRGAAWGWPRPHDCNTEARLAQHRSVPVRANMSLCEVHRSMACGMSYACPIRASRACGARGLGVWGWARAAHMHTQGSSSRVRPSRSARWSDR